MKNDRMFTKLDEMIMKVYNHKNINFYETNLIIKAELELEDGNKKLIEINLDIDSLNEMGAVCINEISEKIG